MAVKSHGVTITFASSFLAEIIDVGNLFNAQREAIDTTHMGTPTYKTFIEADLVDMGSLDLEIAYDPDDTVPINSASETVTITLSNGTTLSFTGFMTAFQPKAPLDDRMTASVTIKISGAITVTPASS